MLHSTALRVASIVLWLMLLMTACVSSAEPVATATALPGSSTPDSNEVTEAPLKREIVFCLGEEPDTLFPYGNPNLVARQVLNAVYDGPLDRRSYVPEQVLLEGLPSLDDNTVVIQQVSVPAGERVAAEDGTPITLGAGALVRPSGCISEDCLVEFSGGELLMDQMVVSFKLLPGLMWSDGTPLTAGDSVYAHRLNADPDIPATKFKIERTASYQAIDETTIVWTGLPGYIDPSYVNNFWPPAPEHLWREFSPADLWQAPVASEGPLGWGPYVIDAWERGEQISLRKNHLYHRADEGLPYFDSLVFRFVGQDADANLAALMSGECDLLDSTTGLESAGEQALQLAAEGKISLTFADGLSWEHLDFGISPIGYDDGYNQGLGDRPDFFGDPRVRRAIAYCLDRQALVDELAWGQAEVLQSYLPAAHPLFNQDVAQYPFEPERGADLLEEVGWVMGESGVRQAQGVAGVLEGTPFELSYLTSEEGQNQIIAERLAGNLNDCGIRISVETLPARELLASGPAGPLFGRQFDLAQFSWPLAEEPPCFLYLGEAVPGDDLSVYRYGWGGWNLTGWADVAYNEACKAARNAIPGQPQFVEAQQRAQEIFAEELPVIPLYAPPQIVAARADICGLDFDPTAGALWNIEAFGYVDLCEPDGE